MAELVVSQYASSYSDKNGKFFTKCPIITARMSTVQPSCIDIYVLEKLILLYLPSLRARRGSTH